MGTLRRTRNGKTDTLPINGGTTTLGRGPECQIIIQDIAASRMHCQIIKTERGFLLRDLSSGNGTLVNGQKVSEHMLKDGDTFQIGAEVFAFSSADAKGAATAAAPAGAKKEATGRIAVPSSKPALPAPGPATKVTTKIQQPAVVSSPPKGGTQKITSSVPVVAASPKPGTQKITTATQPVKKEGTQKIAAAPAKPPTGAHKVPGGTSKPAKPPTGRKGPKVVSTHRYAKDKSTFSMPTTRKGKIIAALGALGLIAVIGGLFLVNSLREKPEELIKKFHAAIDEINKMPDNKPIEKLAKIEEVLNEHANVEKYDRAAYNNLKNRLKPDFQRRALDQKEADSAVKPVIAKYEAAKPDFDDPVKMPRDALQELYDELQSILGTHGNTNWGEKLTAASDDTRKALERRPIFNFAVEWPTTERESGLKANAGKFAEARQILDRFLKRPEVAAKAEYKREVTDKMDSLEPRAKKASEQLLKKAKDAAASGDKEGAKTLLQQALPNYEGFDDAKKEIEKALKDLR